MSTGLSNQRMKGHGNQANGPKDHVGEQEDLESWRNSQQMQQSYATAPVPSDPYMPNYYNTTFATGYPPYGVSEGSWSNGSDPMSFLGGYTTTGEMAPASYIESGVFSGNGNGANYSTTSASYNSFPNAAAPATAFNYFHGNGDYSTWGSNQSMARKPQYEDYNHYREGIYSAPNAGIKGLEHGMQAMGLEHKSDKDLKEPKKMSWATVASQPAKPQPLLLSTGMKKKGPGMPPPPMVPGKHLDIGTWESRNGGVVKAPSAPPPVAVAVAVPPMPTAVVRPVWAGPPVMRHPPPPQAHPVPQPPAVLPVLPPPPPPQDVPVNHQVLDELRVKNNYNPPEFDVNCKNARFFVIKSYSEDDIHRSIKYEIWCSTEHGNKRLDQAFRENENGPIYLFFSVNGSGHFCGMAQMATPVDYHASSSVWAQDKWKGQFRVRWVYVKDVPNGQLRHIRLENNENKPVTNSRDTQEVPFEKGRQVLRVLHGYRHTTSIFDDFFHYEKRQEEEDHKRVPEEREAPSFHKDRNEGERDGRDRGVRDRDTRESRDERDHREHREERDHREPRDQREARQHRDDRESRSHRDQRDSRDQRDERDRREPREQRDTRDHRDERDRREPREQRDTRSHRDDRDRREHREQLETRDHRVQREPRDQPRAHRGARNTNGAHRN